MATINWPGTSGTDYGYEIYPLGTSFKPVAGNYCFAKETEPGYWAPLYFGETGDLSERFESHHKMACAVSRGATHIHVHANGGGMDARLREEADLIDHWKPPCNGT